MAEKERLKMKSENGKTPLGWIITVVIVLIIAGVTVAMLFADNQELSNKIEEYQNKNQNNTVQTQS